MAQWQCSNCGYASDSVTIPEECPSCQSKCTFIDVSCYIPDYGGAGNIDPRLLGKIK